MRQRRGWSWQGSLSAASRRRRASNSGRSAERGATRRRGRIRSVPALAVPALAVPALAVSALAVLALAAAPAAVAAQVSVDVESGAAITGYNDVRIPGDVGTRLSLSDELRSESVPFVRLRLSYDWGRNRLSALYAPLRIGVSGTLDRDARFADASFPAGTPLRGRYVFNSYRLTYRRTVLERRRLTLGLGVTAKVRDAVIALSGAGVTGRKANVGVVPLINFSGVWRWTRGSGLELAGDALAAPQGRAEDVMLAAWYAPSPRLRLRVGYRMLEGGADNAEVYTFALVHYLLAGLTLRL